MRRRNLAMGVEGSTTSQEIPLKLMTVEIVHWDLRSQNLREALVFSGFWYKLGLCSQGTIHTDSRVSLSATLNLPRAVSRGEEGTK